MFENYFKTAFRNLLHNKIYSLINIAGLSIGLSCAMLIMLYVQDEVSYDRFHRNVSQIYRIDKQQTRDNGTVSTGSYTGYFPGPRFSAAIPEIRRYVRFQPAHVDVKKGTDVHSQAVSLVDTSFFSVFDFLLLSGDINTVLAQPNALVITEDMARKYFGNSNAVGELLSINRDGNFRDYVVTGVARNSPQNSSIKFDFLLPLEVSPEDESRNSNWFNSFLSTFVEIVPGTDLQAVQRKMDKVFQSDAGEAISEIKSKYGVKDIGVSYTLEPLAAIHLGEMVPDEGEILADKSNPEFSYILSVVAVFILVIACINFVNLTVARSVKRAKEIGIRKAIGGTRQKLLVQFLSESFILCFIAFGFAVGITITVLPLFNELSGKELTFTYLLSARLVAYYLALFAVTGLLAGAYPAMVLSNYNPVQTLYSRFTLTGKNYLQKSLVVFQFALASFLIVGAVAIYLQFNYLTTQSLGYDDSNLVVVGKYPMTRNEAALFKQNLLKHPDIIDAAPRNAGYSGNTVKVNGNQQINVSVETIDASYLPIINVPVTVGRNFSADHPSDSIHSVIVNESFVSQAGWKEPVGEQISNFEGQSFTVIGVVNDYHYRSMTEKIEPQLFTMNPASVFGVMNVKIKPGTETASVQHIAKSFKELFPLSPFIYNFKQDQNKHSYATEARWKQIILCSAILTIFISCIGLFGLSVLFAEKRTKEIGIRKVLGASVSSIVSILSIDFIKLIIIALVVSIPFAWVATNKWLENYPYRITVGWWLFAAAGALVIGVALLTTSFQSIKAAVQNPVKNLRTE